MRICDAFCIYILLETFLYNSFLFNDIIDEASGVSIKSDFCDTAFFTSLVVSLLFFDLIKSTVWKMQFGSEEEDLDENGLPVIDNSAKLKVGAS